MVLEPELSFSNSSLFSSGAPLEGFTDLAQTRVLGKLLLYPPLIQQDLQKHWPISAGGRGEVRLSCCFVLLLSSVFPVLSGERFKNIGSSKSDLRIRGEDVILI